jgi:hypothetical protein
MGALHRKSNAAVTEAASFLSFARVYAYMCASPMYGGPNAVSSAIVYFGRSHDAVIRVFDAAGNVIETHQHKGDFKEW